MVEIWPPNIFFQNIWTGKVSAPYLLNIQNFIIVIKNTYCNRTTQFSCHHYLIQVWKFKYIGSWIFACANILGKYARTPIFSHLVWKMTEILRDPLDVQRSTWPASACITHRRGCTDDQSQVYKRVCSRTPQSDLPLNITLFMPVVVSVVFPRR